MTKSEIHLKKSSKLCTLLIPTILCTTNFWNHYINYQGFAVIRTIYEKSWFYEPITKNNFPLCGSKSTSAPNTSRSKAASLKAYYNLFLRLFISCQSRHGDLEDFFWHESHKFPPSISQNRAIIFVTMSKVMQILENGLRLPAAASQTDTFIIDGATLNISKQPSSCKSLDVYTNDMML